VRFSDLDRRGTYFDGMITRLAAWPFSSLRQFRTFAQTHCILSLEPLTGLSRSKTLVNVQYLRLRIPSRQVMSFLNAPLSSLHNVIHPVKCPTNVTSDGAATILLRFPRLEYLVLDNCGVVGGAVGIG
jgi:hypothetical protein